ncbi:MAG: choice-of-anchor L domain-containing protein, partial [Salibacteraceae bacterium]
MLVRIVFSLPLVAICGLPFFGGAQTVTPISTTFNSSDTIVNYIRHPSLNAWNLRCLWNDSANCNIYTQDGVGGSCNNSYSPNFRMNNDLTNLNPVSNVFLSGYGALLGFDEGWGMSLVGSGRTLSGMQPFASSYIFGPSLWTAPPNYAVNIGMNKICPQHYSTLIMDTYTILNNSSIGTIDTIMPQILSFDFVSGGTFFDLEFIFASDEYDTLLHDIIDEHPQSYLFQPIPSISNRICEMVNDGVAIFISGNGVNGSFTANSENIALIPGTSDPVCISNIPPLYNSNLSCSTQSNNSFLISNTDTNSAFPFNGFTVPLSVNKIPINPCDTYRINLVLGETGKHGSSTRTLNYVSAWGASALIVKKHSARTGFWYPASLQLYDGLGRDTLAEGCPG